MNNIRQQMVDDHKARQARLNKVRNDVEDVVHTKLSLEKQVAVQATEIKRLRKELSTSEAALNTARYEAAHYKGLYTAVVNKIADLVSSIKHDLPQSEIAEVTFAIVCKHYKVQVRDIQNGVRVRRVARARDAVIYCLREVVGWTHPVISLKTLISHDTCRHSMHRVTRMMKTDEKVRRMVYLCATELSQQMELRKKGVEL